MIIVSEFSGIDHSHCDDVIFVELPYDLRKKSRLRAVSRCGRDVGFQLPRGTELLDSQCFVADSGEVVQIVASPESVSTVTGDTPLKLLKAAYHLGNRHVPLQVTESWLRYQHDHVLDDMVRGLGLDVAVDNAPFQPESGAYARNGGGHHSHSHDQAGGHHH